MSHWEEIFQYCAKCDLPVVYVATQEGGNQPRVRPMSLMVHDRKFYLATAAKSRKSGEIAKHDSIELVLLIPEDKFTGYLRVAGHAVKVNDAEAMSNIATATGYPVDTYWPKGVTDPDFAMFQIDPVRIEYMKPGEMDAIDVTEEYSDLIND